MENFVYLKGKDGSIYSGGYKVNSQLMDKTLSGGGGVSNMIVPAGLFLSKKALEGNKTFVSDILKDVDVIGDDLYSKLVSLAAPSLKTKKKAKTKKKTKTRKHKQVKRVNTRRIR